MTNVITKTIAAALLGLASMSASAFLQHQGGTSTGYGTAQVPQSVAYAKVIHVRDVKIHGQPTVAATTLGGALCGVTGYAVGDKVSSNPMMRNLLGLAAGTSCAAVVNQKASVLPGQEIIIKLDGVGLEVSITQSVTDGVHFRPGQEVMVIGGNRIAPRT